MDSVRLEKLLKAERARVEKELRRLTARRAGIPLRLHQAMLHSLLGGGKRLRPVILLWTFDAVTAGRGKAARTRAEALPAACALEMLHTYSLIHDDLPAMDDDVLRRGRPTCHVAFDESTAILAGDGLQAWAFQLLAEAGGQQAGPLVELAARAVGPAGMVGGQQEDLDAEGRTPDPRLVQSIHLKKTAALLEASFAAGAVLAGARPGTVAALSRAGRQLGLAFQGADDVLDITASSAQMGKSAGKDAAAGKATWVALEGLDRAWARTGRQGRKGLSLLEQALPAGEPKEKLLALGSLMWNRDR